jgi:hypothetical protein
MKAKIKNMSDFIKFSDREIQMILKKVDNSQLSIAIKGCSANVIKKFYNNMSGRASDMIKEHIKTVAPNKKEKETARNFLYSLGLEVKKMKERATLNQNRGIEALKEVKIMLKDKNSSSMNLEALVELFDLLSPIARGLGILKIEEVISQIDDQFIKLGLALTVDGTDPELVLKMLSIREEAIISFQKKKLNMVKTLILSLQKGDNPRITEILGKCHLEDGFKM